MDQSARLKMLNAFRNNEVTFLIASDVAARGLDIPEVSHVINFDVPIHAEDYVHRIGRTGRAGREGQAFTMVTPEETKYLSAIQSLIKKEIEWFPVPGAGASVESDEPAVRERPARAPRGDKRPPRARKEVAVEAPRPVADSPKPEVVARPPRAEKPSRRSHHNDNDAAPDDGGFHEGNMPAFLMQK